MWSGPCYDHLPASGSADSGCSPACFHLTLQMSVKCEAAGGGWTHACMHEAWLCCCCADASSTGMLLLTFRRRPWPCSDGTPQPEAAALTLPALVPRSVVPLFVIPLLPLVYYPPRSPRFAVSRFGIPLVSPWYPLGIPLVSPWYPLVPRFVCLLSSLRSKASNALLDN
jgi:hypothetical protein